MDDSEGQLAELKTKLGVKFNYARTELGDNSIGKHTKLYHANKRTQRSTKVEGRSLLDDKGRAAFLKEVQEKATLLQERINKIVENKSFSDILRNTNHKKIINSLNVALCTFRKSDQVLKDFEMRLESPLAKHASKWTYGTYNYNPKWMSELSRATARMTMKGRLGVYKENVDFDFDL